MTTDTIIVKDLGVPDGEVMRMLDELDDARREPLVEIRASQRNLFRGKGVLVMPDATTDPSTAYWVRLRDISAQGAAFIVGDEIAPGTRIRLEIPTGHGRERTEKAAVVQRCRHLEGTIHEIGVEFEVVSSS